MINEILLQFIAEYHQGLNELAGRGKATEQALTAIYEIGLECIGAADEEEYPDDLRRNWQIVRNQTLASQRKAWAKACGVKDV